MRRRGEDCKRIEQRREGFKAREEGMGRRGEDCKRIERRREDLKAREEWMGRGSIRENVGISEYLYLRPVQNSSVEHLQPLLQHFR